MYNLDNSAFKFSFCDRNFILRNLDHTHLYLEIYLVHIIFNYFNLA